MAYRVALKARRGNVFLLRLQTFFLFLFERFFHIYAVICQVPNHRIVLSDCQITDPTFVSQPRSSLSDFDSLLTMSITVSIIHHLLTPGLSNQKQTHHFLRKPVFESTGTVS